MSTTETTITRCEFEVFNLHDESLARGGASTFEEAEHQGRRYLVACQKNGPCTLEVRRVEILTVRSSDPAGGNPASDVNPPPPFSEDELREQWDAQADVDEGNHWDNLGLDEQLAWAQTRAIAADRAQEGPRDLLPSVKATEQAAITRYEFEVFGEHGQTVAIGDAATLEEAEREGRQYLAQYQQDGPCTLELRRVDVLSVSDSQPAPSPADLPLWRVMGRAYNNAPELPDGIEDRQMYAAEIVAVRNWLKRRLPEGGAWYVLLTTESDRAERGE